MLSRRLSVDMSRSNGTGHEPENDCLDTRGQVSVPTLNLSLYGVLWGFVLLFSPVSSLAGTSSDLSLIDGISAALLRLHHCQ